MKSRSMPWRALAQSVAMLVAARAWPAADVAPPHLASDEGVEIAYLVRQGTADSLATAALLAHLTQEPDAAAAAADPTQLMQRAMRLAADRPELIWLDLRNCQISRCPDEAAIAGRLKRVDPDNGLAWLSDLRAVPPDAPAQATKLIEQIGALHARIYWNKLVVMMFDALTHRAGAPPATAITHDADDRLSHVIGVLAALDAPAFQVLARDCKDDQFNEPGRRAACQTIAARLEEADSVLEQNVSMTLQRSLAHGGPEREALQRKYLEQRYRTVASNRERDGKVNSDAEKRVDEMRRLPREQDVEQAMLVVFNEPLVPPADWHEPGVGG